MIAVDFKVLIHTVFDGLIIWNLEHLYRSSDYNIYEKFREDLVLYLFTFYVVLLI